MSAHLTRVDCETKSLRLWRCQRLPVGRAAAEAQKAPGRNSQQVANLRVAAAVRLRGNPSCQNPRWSAKLPESERESTCPHAVPLHVVRTSPFTPRGVLYAMCSARGLALSGVSRESRETERCHSAEIEINVILRAEPRGPRPRRDSRVRTRTSTKLLPYCPLEVDGALRYLSERTGPLPGPAPPGARPPRPRGRVELPNVGS
jgi:hypothetical protein